MEEIVIDFDSNGNATIEGKGFVGNDCKLITKEIEEALGTVERVVEKPEMRRQKSVLKKAGA